jgi:hypothetical protein
MCFEKGFFEFSFEDSRLLSEFELKKFFWVIWRLRDESFLRCFDNIYKDLSYKNGVTTVQDDCPEFKNLDTL